MTMNATQAVIWKQITDAYAQWDHGRNERMPVHMLQEKLATVPPELIGETLAQAASEDQAEVGSVGEDPSFRPTMH
ncbi:hypothetical protein SAMN06265795_11226 [Noviherbaspirillum humi]|uniref:Uncharacterized protein n=1 Tax=Noviherbaspirillum humi TaxID=1688639 RepID=A0A239J9F8_9BURK|nr:hypothetical protein [Noviherbaspirillum humi]SNT02435.1 hypothetical protein SAMN06265795_11226 [Noviherbaspirillum humi]